MGGGDVAAALRKSPPLASRANGTIFELVATQQPLYCKRAR